MDEPAYAPAPEFFGLETSASSASGMEAHAARYNVDVRTVQRWNAAGRRINDLPPFDNPPAMCAWWERLRALGIWRNRIPAEIEAAATRWTSGIVEPAASSPEAASAPPAVTDDLGPVAALSAAAIVEEIASQPIDLTEFETADMTFDAGAKMAKLNYQVHAKLLRDALGTGKPDLMRSAHSAFEKAFEMYVTSEARKSKIMAEQGLTVPRDEVRQVLIELHAPIPKRLKAGLRAAWKVMPEPRCAQVAWNAAVDMVVDTACQQLVESRFAPPETVPAFSS